TPHFQPDAALVLFQPVVKIDAQRALFRQAFDDTNVAGRDYRRVGLMKALRESTTVPGEQLTHSVRWIDQRQRVVEPVAPGPDDRFDLLLKRRTLHHGRRTAGTADDEVDAHQRTVFPEKRIKGRYTTDKNSRQIGADLRADVAVVALARHVHQHRDKAIESVAPRQHAHARTFIKLKNGEREAVECVFVNLE